MRNKAFVIAGFPLRLPIAFIGAVFVLLRTLVSPGSTAWAFEGDMEGIWRWLIGR